MTQIFLEVYSYHMETLYPCVSNFAKSNDIVLYDLDSPGAEMLQGLPQRKYKFSIYKLMHILRTEKVSCIYINTISLNLYASSFTGWVKALKIIFDELKKKYFVDKDDFKEVSMGMSGDYLLAIEEGATIVRVGSSIFGSRS